MLIYCLKGKIKKMHKRYGQAIKDEVLAIKIVVSFIQIQLSMQSTLGGSYVFPEVYLSFLSSLEFVNLDLINVFGVQCNFAVDFTMTIMAGLIFVTLVAATVFIFFVLQRRNIRNKTHDLSIGATQNTMNHLFDLSMTHEPGLSESSEIDATELISLLGFVADGKLHHEVEKLKKDKDKLKEIMLHAGATPSKTELNVWKLSRENFLQATTGTATRTLRCETDIAIVSLHHFVPILQATKQVKEQQSKSSILSALVQFYLLVHTPISAKGKSSFAPYKKCDFDTS